MTARTITLTAGVVCLAAVLATSASGSSRALDLRGRIIFSRAGGKYGQETIYYANANGSGQRRLSGFGATCCARISHDGKHVLFAAGASGGRITTATENVNGTGRTTIPLPDSTLNLGPGAWSPNGQQIAFQGWDNTNSARNGVYIGDASNGGNLQRLTTDSVYSDLPGDFSPDGTSLALLRSPPNANSTGSIWVINTNGTNLHRVTPANLTVGFGTIRWSPDGTTILFASARTARTGALWTIHPDGTHLRKLFHEKNRFPISPTWSPNGRQIMFALDTFRNEDDHRANGLYVIDTDGTHFRLVIRDATFKDEPDWVR